MSARVVRLASRASPLARYQAELVAKKLAGVRGVGRVEIVNVTTAGDQSPEQPIRTFATRGIFTNGVDREVILGRADAAVHSAKDLPASELGDGLVIGAVPDRADARDALVGGRLADLKPGAVIATGAIRRRAQLAFIRPDLTFADLRGNIARRVDRAPSGGASVVALAALHRLGKDDVVAEVLSEDIMLPQVAQGAIAVRCRAWDWQLRVMLAAIDDRAAHREVRAERAFLRGFGGGCDAPVAAHASCAEADGEITIEGLVATSDGHVVIRRRLVGKNPEAIGAELAAMLVERDGASIALDL